MLNMIRLLSFSHMVIQVCYTPIFSRNRSLIFSKKYIKAFTLLTKDGRKRHGGPAGNGMISLKIIPLNAASCRYMEILSAGVNRIPEYEAIRLLQKRQPLLVRRKFPGRFG